MPTLKTLTLGCKVNQYETEFIRQTLAGAGYHEAASGEPADLCLVNTCTVTAEADRKSRKLIRQLARENPGARIVVMGCYATRRPEQAAALPGVTEVVTDKRDLPDWLARSGARDIPAGITSFGRRRRAYVKIQDGCQMHCAYCIIPHVRPVLTSRPMPQVVDEIRGLVEAGHREIVLTGIHLGHYGVDLRSPQESPSGPLGEKRGRESLFEEIWSKPKTSWQTKTPDPFFPGITRSHSAEADTNLARLLRRLAAINGSFRLRISSIEAVEVTDELLNVMAEHPDRVCPHLHVSMQSGSDAVLRRMQRRQTAAQFVDRCQRIEECLDRPGLTTDVIVGFPGETDADFEATCRVAEAVGFSKIHVFRFSPRPGTAAAQMTDTVPADVQQRRASHLSQVGQKTRTAYFESLVGEPLSILVESAARGRPGILLGTSARYVPVELAGPRQCVGQLVQATAQAVVADRVQCALARAGAIC